jgi:hypothetical protein
MSTLYKFDYHAPSGNTYAGYVAADPSTPYAYTAGQTIASNGGTYTIGQPVYTDSTAPAGSVYCTIYYDKATDKYYPSYHYDTKTNGYYNIGQPYNGTGPGYDPKSGMYYTKAGDASSAVPAAAGSYGLGSEYDYAKSADNSYHVYGGGGVAAAKVTPDSVGVTGYDYKFSYPDGSYYTGTVYDDGTYHYAPGMTKQTQYGTYTITGKDPHPAGAGVLAGYVYDASEYQQSNGQTYTPYSATPGTSYYGKPAGYGGLGTETDYIKIASGYVEYGRGGQYNPSTGTPMAAVPPLA